MLQKTVTTETRDPLGLQVELDKHRRSAEKDLGPVALVSTSNEARPDPDNVNDHIYAITSTWKQDNAPGA